jgi:hypothetical protein
MIVTCATVGWNLLGPTWDVRHRFAETTGEIVSARIREEGGGFHYYPEFLIRFTPEGQPRREVWGFDLPPRGFSQHPAAWEVIDRRAIGARVPCWYDPADPAQVTLVHDWQWVYFVVLAIPLAILAFGLYGLRHAWSRWGLSPEAAAQDMSAVWYILLFVGGFLDLLGLGLFSAIVFDRVVPEHRAAHSYTETTCVVLDSRMQTSHGKTTKYRPEFKIRYQTPAFADPIETWAYRASDVTSSGLEETKKTLSSFRKGETYPCWYDPDRPHWVVLDRSMSWSTYLLVLVPFLPLTPGALLTFYSLRGLRASDSGLPADGDTTGKTGRGFPTTAVPLAGHRLAYRLTDRGSLWRQFWTFLAVAVIWNIVAWSFASMAIRNAMKGKPEWFLTIFSVLIALFGLLIVVATVRAFFAALRIPPAVLELSHWPLTAGMRFKFHATQGGREALESLVVGLVCEESTTFREGTRSRIETARVADSQLLRREGSEIAGRIPFDVEGEWTIPHAAMHSFKSGRCSITWKIVIEARFPGKDSIQTEIVVPVRPRGASPRGSNYDS